MARKDELTGKKALSGNTRSHALNHSKRKWQLNLQQATIQTGPGRTKVVKVSARTLKGLRKNNKLAVKKAKPAAKAAVAA